MDGPGRSAVAPRPLSSGERTTMRRLALTLALGLLAVTAGGGSTGGAPASTTRSEYRLTDAEPSIDSLLEKFRHALETKDKQLPRQLPGNPEEDLHIIIPRRPHAGPP